MQTSLFIKRYWLECAFSFICVSSPPLSYQQNNIQKNRPRLYNETDLSSCYKKDISVSSY